HQARGLRACRIEAGLRPDLRRAGDQNREEWLRGRAGAGPPLSSPAWSLSVLQLPARVPRAVGDDGAVEGADRAEEDREVAMNLAQAFDGKNVLVTGGLGFIGSNLARRLVQLGANVTLVDSMIPDYGGNPFNIHDIRDHLTVNIADVRDRSSMDYLVQGRDYLFNLAGQVSHIDSMRDPFTDLDIN